MGRSFVALRFLLLGGFLLASPSWAKAKFSLAGGWDAGTNSAALRGTLGFGVDTEAVDFALAGGLGWNVIGAATNLDHRLSADLDFAFAPRWELYLNAGWRFRSPSWVADAGIGAKFLYVKTPVFDLSLSALPLASREWIDGGTSRTLLRLSLRHRAILRLDEGRVTFRSTVFYKPALASSTGNGVVLGPDFTDYLIDLQHEAVFRVVDALSLTVGHRLELRGKDFFSALQFGFEASIPDAKARPSKGP